MGENNIKDSSKNKDSKEKKKDVMLPEDAIRSCFINRELSWLEFNLRVLQEAADHKNPLLERMKFLMIYESNLEEFFRVRVGILTHRDALMPDREDPLSGWTASEVLDQIMVKVSIQQALAEGIWKTLKEELKDEGIDILDFKKISKVDELMCKKHFIGFRHLLSPRIIEPGRPFPFLWNQESYVIAILGRDPDPRIAVIPLFRFPPYTAFELDGRQKIVLTARLVRQFLPNLLKKEEIRESAVISVTRNADMFIEENAENEDFRDKMTKMLKKRRREMPVRLRVFGKLSPATKTLLAKKFNISEQRIFTTSIPFDLSFRSAIREKEGYKYEERKPARNIGLNKGQYFKYLEHKDILISCPFQNMVPFVDLLYEAVDDPDVISIKITLYRLSSSSKVAAALAYAADRGKDVLCLLELRARFDEQSNIDYSEMLEDAGCRVIYGLPDQKVHSKLCLITRMSDGNLRHITQVGTGNYNEVTSEQYTDLSLITADEDVAEDAEMVFAALEAGEFPPESKALWVAPLSFKKNLIRMMDREIAKGSKGRICIKVNSLNNREVMQKLIECSKAGVKVELFIRGICCLRPGIPGMTDNIKIKSVVGRWLEHSRIYQFGSGEDERIFIGSGDLLNRNLERRVEVFIEVKSDDTREQIHEILNAFRDDKEKARTMQPDGTYVREKGGKGTSSQERLYRYFHDRKISLPPPESQPLLTENEESIETRSIEPDLGMAVAMTMGQMQDKTAEAEVLPKEMSKEQTLAEQPPVEQPPAEQPPAEQPPVEQTEGTAVETITQTAEPGTPTSASAPGDSDAKDTHLELENVSATSDSPELAVTETPEEPEVPTEKMEASPEETEVSPEEPEVSPEEPEASPEEPEASSEEPEVSPEEPEASSEEQDTLEGPVSTESLEEQNRSTAKTEMEAEKAEEAQEELPVEPQEEAQEEAQEKAQEEAQEEAQEKAQEEPQEEAQEEQQEEPQEEPEPALVKEVSDSENSTDPENSVEPENPAVPQAPQEEPEPASEEEKTTSSNDNPEEEETKEASDQPSSASDQPSSAPEQPSTAQEQPLTAQEQLPTTQDQPSSATPDQPETEIPKKKVGFFKRIFGRKNRKS